MGTIQGKISQAEIGLYPGTQCTSMATAACVMASMKAVSMWDHKDIDRLIEFGNRLHEESIHTYQQRFNVPPPSNKYLCVDEVLRSGSFDGRAFSFDLDEGDIPIGGFFTLENVAHVFEWFQKSGKVGVLTCNNRSIAILNYLGYLFIMDSHASVGGGKAMLGKYISAQSCALAARSILHDPNPLEIFTLTPIIVAPSATTTKAFGSMKIGDNTPSVLEDIHKLVDMFKAIELYKQGKLNLQSALIKIGDLAGGPNGIFYNDKHDEDSHYIRNKYGYIQRNHQNQINEEGIYFEKLYHLKIMLEDKDFIKEGTDFHTDFSSKEETLKSDLFNLKQKIGFILNKVGSEDVNNPAIQEIVETLGVNNPSIQGIIDFSICHYEKMILKRIKNELKEFEDKKIDFSIRDDKYYFARKFIIIGELLHEFTECKIIEKKDELLQAFKNLDQIRSTLIHCHKKDYLVPDDKKKVINQIINNLNTIIRNINEENYLQVDYTDKNKETAKSLKDDSEELKKILKGTNSITEINKHGANKILNQNQTDDTTDEEIIKRELHKKIKQLIVEASNAIENRKTNKFTIDKFLGKKNIKYQEFLGKLDDSEKQGYPSALTIDIIRNNEFSKEITQKVQQQKKQPKEKCKLEKKQSRKQENESAKIYKIIDKINGEMDYLKKVVQQENIGTKKDYIIQHIASIIGQYLKDIEDLDNTKYIPTISRIIIEAIISAKSARNQGLAHNIFSFDSGTFEQIVKNDIIPAHEHFQSILNIYEHVRSPIKSVIILHHLGYSFCKLCLYPEAIKYFKQTVELLSMGITQKHENVKLKDFDQLGIEKYHFIAQTNLASTYLLAGDYNEAYNVLKLITEKIDLSSTDEGSISDDFRAGIAEILINFSSYFVSQGNYRGAQEYCENARNILPENLIINMNLAGLYRKLGEHDKKTKTLEYIGTIIGTKIGTDPIAKCGYLECCADSLLDQLKEKIEKVDEMLAYINEMEETFENNIEQFKVAYSDRYLLIKLTPIKLRIHIIYEKSIATKTQEDFSGLQSQLNKLEEECKNIISSLKPALKLDAKLTNLYRILTCCFASMINSNNMNNGPKNLEQAQYYFASMINSNNINNGPKNLEQAKNYFVKVREAAHSYQELRDSAAEKLAIAYSNYSYLHINDTETEERIKYLEITLKIQEEHHRDKSVTLSNLGMEYCNLGLRFAKSWKFKDADSNFRKALSYFGESEESNPLPKECLVVKHKITDWVKSVV